MAAHAHAHYSIVVPGRLAAFLTSLSSKCVHTNNKGRAVHEVTS